MTNEEAIKILKFEGGYFCDFKGCQEQQAFAMAIKALEQEPVLDKIRAEIEQEYNHLSAIRADETLELGECLGLKMSLKIINKYKAESEG